VVAAADYFFSRWWTAAAVSLAFGTVPIERKPGAAASGSAGEIDRLVEQGWNLVLFPEGTRTRTGSMGRFKPGAAYMAIRHSIPIVPVRLTGTHEMMPVGASWARQHPLVVHFGDALVPRPGETNRALTLRLRRALDELARQDGVAPV
jgi:1-acyl-sn-glycerol-3-phosphate acyltransferase